MEDTIRFDEIAIELGKAALEKKARDVVALDMTHLISYADSFVLCTASNTRQVKAIAEAVRVHGKNRLGLHLEGVEGLEASKWVLVDFGEVVVHVFDGPLRGFYDLDGLWADAPRIVSPELEASETSEASFLV